MILLPLVFGYFLARKFKLTFKDIRKLFVAGALTFIVSQVLHIPLIYRLTAMSKNGTLPKITAGTNVVLGTLGLETLVAILGVGLLVYTIRLRNSFPIDRKA
jgi:hypothetical protein